MDSITQFLMGAVVGQIILGPKKQGKGALIGGLIATIPDLDVIPLVKSSVITQLVHHRGLSHSLLFCGIIPVFGASLSQRYLSWNISFKRWYLVWFLAFTTHILLDLMTIFFFAQMIFLR